MMYQLWPRNAIYMFDHHFWSFLWLWAFPSRPYVHYFCIILDFFWPTHYVSTSTCIKNPTIYNMICWSPTMSARVRVLKIQQSTIWYAGFLVCLDKFWKKLWKKYTWKSDTWLTSHLSQRTSKPSYHIVDCRISSKLAIF